MSAAIHSLDHFSFAVPDVASTATFYERFGLDVRADNSGFTLRASGSDHVWGRIHEGPRKAIGYLSFGAYEQDMPQLRKQLAERGLTLLPPPKNAVDDTGMWFQDPDGTLLEIRVATKVSPDVKAALGATFAPPDVAGAPLRSDAEIVRPDRLSHVLVFTSDVSRAIDFYRETVGLQLSDRARDGIGFMHGAHGSDHHLVAFAKSDARGFHHCSWNVASVSDVGLGAMQMADAGYTRGWGMGRHVLGSNYFNYIRDPWGSYSEYSYDIDFVTPGAVAKGTWKATDASPENGFYLWGPLPPDDFALNYESPSAELQRDLVASEPR